MADRYVSATATGSGNGTSGSRWTILQALQLAVAGDRVLIGPGTYAATFAPSSAGTGDADAARIRWEAENPLDRPVFDGSRLAATGAAAAPAETSGWAPVNGSGIVSYAGGFTSGANFPYVYRKLGFNGTVFGVWCDDFDTGANPAGVNCALWSMHFYNQPGAPYSNPDWRIHEAHAHTSGNDFYRDTTRVMHDWKSQACAYGSGDHSSGYGPADALDIRLHRLSSETPNDSPANHSVYVATRERGINLAKSYHSLKNLTFRRHKGHQAVGAVGLVLDGCTFEYMGWTGLTLDEGSHNARIVNCTFRGAGSSRGHYDDLLHVTVSNNVVIENNSFSWGGHGTIFIDKSHNGVIRGNTLANAPTGITFDKGVPNNWTVEENHIADCGWTDNMNVHCSPHAGFQIGQLTNSLLRRNTILRTGIGFFLTAGGPQNVINNNRFEHNTLLGSEQAAVHMISYAGGDRLCTNNSFRNNLFRGLDGDVGIRNALLWVDLTNVGVDLDGNTFRANLYYHPSEDGKDPPALSVWGRGSKSNILGSGGGAESYPAAFGTSATDKGVEANPLLVNEATGDMHLQAASPAIGAGIVIAGESYNGTPDIGAYEYVTGGNQPPTATIVSISSRTPVVNTSVSFQGSGTDSDGTIAGYDWNFGDGATSTAQNPTHTYTATGTFTVRLTVTDDDGAVSAAVTDTITVRSASSAAQIPFLGSNCSASSSQTTPNYGPAGAVDGNDLQTTPLVDTGRWVANSGVDPNLTLPQWWQARSVDTYRVEEAHLQFQKADAGRVYVFDLDLSPDGTTWTRVATDAQSSIAGDFYTVLTFSPVEAQYHRVTLKSNNSNNQFAGLWEYEAFGTLIAAGGGDTSSAYTIAAGNVTDTLGTSAASRYAPGTVVDGKRGRASDPPWCWSARIRAVDGSPQSVGLIFNLGSSVPVGRVKLAPYRPSRYLYALNVATSPDGTTWTDRFPANQATGRAEWSEFAFTPVSAQYVKVTFTGENLTGRPSIVRVWECEVYPA